MKSSLKVGAIAKAMAAAQKEMSNPTFDSSNPHFRSKFASLASVRNAVIPVMAKHGITVSQEPRQKDAPKRAPVEEYGDSEIPF